MAAEARIRELDAKHARLETAISEERKHPAADNLHLMKLKKQKLRIKEEIETLKRV